MAKIHRIAREWALTRSVPAIEPQWIALLFEERRAGRLSSRASTGEALKAMLAPFKSNLDELRRFVAETQTALGGSSSAAGHGVFSKARSIPVGGEGPGAEPEPVMGDLEALGGPKPEDEDEDELQRRLAYLTRKILGRKK